MIPSTRHPFRISKAALGLIVASLLLALLLAANTLRNLDREQRLMENFLLREGLTVIRAFEAGARTTLRHHMRPDITDGDPMATLAAETASEKGVAYIRIVNEHGEVVAEAGSPPAALTVSTVERVLAADRPVTRLLEDHQVFEIAREFRPLRGNGPGFRKLQQRWRQWCRSETTAREPSLAPLRQVIFVGLTTDEFAQIRRQEIRHGLFMGGILFLLGSAGLYFIFLYQEVHVARATLADMERYTDNVLNSMPAGLITLDPEGRLVSCNRKAVELLGSQLETALGRPAAQALAFWPPALADAGAEVRNLSVDWRRADGKSIPVKLHSSRLRGRDGRELGLVVILQDMREIRAMEQRLERSRRLAALGKMAAGVAHEIRNPLGTLKGFAQYFANRAADGESREYAELMVGEVDRLNGTVSALLQFARPREPVLKRVAARDLLGRAARLLAADFSAAGVEFSLDCPEDLTFIADPDLILQVILNCLKNSIAATPAGGRITLSATLIPHTHRRQTQRTDANAGGIPDVPEDMQTNADTVVIEIADQGRGMTPEEQERMFDPFYTTRSDGTGLGLAVSHQIVEQHQGRFEVTSQPGRGTRIRIILPQKETDDRA